MFLILMGVAGSGKTTIGTMLAARLNCPFYDADDYHSPANVAKMQAGIPLNDANRADWLQRLADIIRASLAQNTCGILACSALKEKYRQQLRVDARQVRFVYLHGSYQLIRQRLIERHGHYMPPELLESQFAALEEPRDAIVVEIDAPPSLIVDQILTEIEQNV